MLYRTPKVVDYGSIAGHTYATPGGQVKGGENEDPNHLDMYCEWSGGSAEDWPTC
jgi:hypothetical protein